MHSTPVMWKPKFNRVFFRSNTRSISGPAPQIYSDLYGRPSEAKPSKTKRMVNKIRQWTGRAFVHRNFDVSGDETHGAADVPDVALHSEVLTSSALVDRVSGASAGRTPCLTDGPLPDVPDGASDSDVLSALDMTADFDVPAVLPRAEYLEERFPFGRRTACSRTHRQIVLERDSGRHAGRRRKRICLPSKMQYGRPGWSSRSQVDIFETEGSGTSSLRVDRNQNIANLAGNTKEA